jgi:hypothetical protein
MSKTLVAIGDSITKGTYTSETDLGANSVADKVVLGGKLTILVLSLPIIESLLTLIKSFLELI